MHAPSVRQLHMHRHAMLMHIPYRNGIHVCWSTFLGSPSSDTKANIPNIHVTPTINRKFVSRRYALTSALVQVIRTCSMSSTAISPYIGVRLTVKRTDGDRTGTTAVSGARLFLHFGCRHMGHFNSCPLSNIVMLQSSQHFDSLHILHVTNIRLCSRHIQHSSW